MVNADEERRLDYKGGEHDRKLDYKGRLSIPDGLLSGSGDGWSRAVILKERSALGGSRGDDVTYLSLYDLPTWNEYLAVAHRTIEDPDERRLFMHRVVGDISQVELDASQRITLPERLLQYAKIEKQGMVRLVGVFDHIEVWNPDLYDANTTAGEAEGLPVPSIADLARGRIREVS